MCLATRTPLSTSLSLSVKHHIIYVVVGWVPCNSHSSLCTDASRLSTPGCYNVQMSRWHQLFVHTNHACHLFACRHQGWTAAYLSSKVTVHGIINYITRDVVPFSMSRSLNSSSLPTIITSSSPLSSLHCMSNVF